MTKYIECIKCHGEQPVTSFITMSSGEIKRTCKSCKNGHKRVLSRLRKENTYPDDTHKCFICERTLEQVSRTGQLRMKNWVLDHCHNTETFRGWICHHCNTGLGAFTDSTYKLGRAMQYLDNHKSKLERQEFLYSEKDLPDLREELKQEEIEANECDERNYHKLQYSNRHRREVNRIKKLIKFIEHKDLEVEDYEDGTVLINGKFVVTLLNDNWRILHKNKWYRHKNDLNHFIDNYILKERKYETRN